MRATYVRSNEERSGRPLPKLTLKIARFTALLPAALAVLVAVPITATAGLSGAARYAGKTNHSGAVTLRLTADAKRVETMRIRYKLICDDDQTSHTYTDILNAKVRRDGSFKSSGTYKGTTDNSKNKFHVAGTISKRKASGTFSLTETNESGQGDTIRCKSGRLTWTAKRR
jgi:hypothetical protein